MAMSARPLALNKQAAQPRCAAHRSPLRPATAPSRPVARRVIEIDFSDSDTQVAVAGIVLGLVAGIGAPLFYINRTERDEERLNNLRALNRATFEQTGEYMDEGEISKVRKPKWTDRKEWVDED
eukprot:CAMPEP_0119108622 /NCGR_PEP_ID=MMETSP1180-20130426/15509_1 /TAXON_ID=3052 ORGANISM="Chlamydomonas cf sp, Strain CCMP681" /NCGR_SAMPLE_ID=MMETSP1180 /ASSEMBLY_ACC=CAM_ASM_000741 /LENGTH=123 /DNA_ID=CAMNT_0007094257 /DNA_START=22 /DNA_END=393 /DNA_ORIENTATION=-